MQFGDLELTSAPRAYCEILGDVGVRIVNEGERFFWVIDVDFRGTTGSRLAVLEGSKPVEFLLPSTHNLKNRRFQRTTWALYVVLTLHFFFFTTTTVLSTDRYIGVSLRSTKKYTEI